MQITPFSVTLQGLSLDTLRNHTLPSVKKLHGEDTPQFRLVRHHIRLRLAQEVVS